MALLGGERPLSIPAAVLAAVIGAGVVAVASDTRGVAVEALAADLALAPTRDAATGIVTLRGPRVEVKLAPGIALASVNGNPVALDQPTWVRAGQVYVDAAFADELGRLLAGPSAASPPEPIANVVPADAAPEVDRGSPARAAAPLTARRRVVLDAGHGGKFDGTVGPTGLREKDLTLALAAVLGDRLAAMGVDVLQTRRSDCSLSEDWSEDLDLRVAVADRANADLFVSLHFNSEPTGAVQGFEIHLPLAAEATGTLGDARDGGLQAAQGIRAALRETLDTPDRGLKFGRKRVVWRPAVPAVLVEYAFISHPSSERRYRDPAALAALADATARGIGRYLATLPPPGAPGASVAARGR